VAKVKGQDTYDDGSQRPTDGEYYENVVRELELRGRKYFLIEEKQAEANERDGSGPQYLTGPNHLSLLALRLYQGGSSQYLAKGVQLWAFQVFNRPPQSTINSSIDDHRTVT
jgi:hypothetical protein